MFKRTKEIAKGCGLVYISCLRECLFSQDEMDIDNEVASSNVHQNRITERLESMYRRKVSDETRLPKTLRGLAYISGVFTIPAVIGSGLMAALYSLTPNK